MPNPLNLPHPFYMTDGIADLIQAFREEELRKGVTEQLQGMAVMAGYLSLSTDSCNDYSYIVNRGLDLLAVYVDEEDELEWAFLSTSLRAVINDVQKEVNAEPPPA